MKFTFGSMDQIVTVSERLLWNISEQLKDASIDQAAIINNQEILIQQQAELLEMTKLTKADPAVAPEVPKDLPKPKEIKPLLQSK